ncbi:uncharacterized protein LOC135378875 [Ornithodoros turicata]|uniref:uncharacterized protein LOC135378875 n=1 Tax=Ornithodoros turicata TaxID=34597 RepID=UPI0031388D03
MLCIISAICLAFIVPARSTALLPRDVAKDVDYEYGTWYRTSTRRPPLPRGLIPVRESDPGSTVHLWRPYTVYFVGDRYFDSLQRVVPRSENVTEFYLYAQSYLNMVVYNMRELQPGCDTKIKVLGTRVFTVQEEEIYLPKRKDNVASVDITNIEILEEFISNNPEVNAADMVVFLTGHPLGEYQWTEYRQKTSRMCSRQKFIVLTDHPFSYSVHNLTSMLVRLMGDPGFHYASQRENHCLTIRNAYRKYLSGNEESDGEPILCYNTYDTCCLPHFYGIYNARREPVCRRYSGMLAPSTTGDMCKFKCTSIYYFLQASTGTVKNPNSEYWSKSLLCPSPEDEICFSYDYYGEGRRHFYKNFKKAIFHAWELDDYEIPETDITFCMQ